MKAKINKSLCALLVLACLLLSYVFLLSLHPVKIVAVHGDGNYSYILVKNFPFTDKGKIIWWLKNRDMLKNIYGIPRSAIYGGYDVTFWDFGDGYKEEEKYDRLCFNDMPTEINCIDKKPLFTIRRFNYERELFITYEGRYQLKDNGEIIKVKRE